MCERGRGFGGLWCVQSDVDLRPILALGLEVGYASLEWKSWALNS